MTSIPKTYGEVEGLVTMLIAACDDAVPPNRFYGFRTPRTLSSERIWYRANRFAGWAMLIAAIVSASALALVPQEVLAAPGYAAGIFVAPILGAVVASFLYLRSLSNGRPSTKARAASRDG